MGLISRLKDWWQSMFLNDDVQEVFGVDIESSIMDAWISKYYDITAGKPYWKDIDDDIESINFAQYIDDVTSGLVTLDIDVRLPEGQRGDYLQKIANYIISGIDGKVSDALGNAGIMLKPNGTGIDYYYPNHFIVTDSNSNGDILGCIFVRKKYSGKKIYTKYEWHRFEEDGDVKYYRVTNKVYESLSETDKGKEVELVTLPFKDWAELAPDVWLENIEYPLFAYYANPKPNNIDRGSALKLPFWGNCIKELKDLDIAWSRKSTEIEDSKHITFVPQMAVQFADNHNIKLPRFLKPLQVNADAMKGAVTEHVAKLLTEDRIKDINSILAMISTKLGFDQGFFVLDEKTGAITATQVEADDQSTIRTIKNLRDPLRNTILQVLYGASKFADLYTDVPAESWSNSFDELAENVVFNFGDITYNYEEDKASWWKYRVQGDVPAWMYYVKFEGMAEDEAKAMIEEASVKDDDLFNEE